MEHREHWRHPVTQELAELELYSGVAQLRREKTLTERRHSLTWVRDSNRVKRQRITTWQLADLSQPMDLPRTPPSPEPPLIGMRIAGVYLFPPEDRELSGAFDTELRAEGFIRQMTRQADGSLWLPEELEPWRAQLEASEQPVLRLSGDAARLPARWGSKLGGVPYRPPTARCALADYQKRRLPAELSGAVESRRTQFGWTAPTEPPL